MPRPPRADDRGPKCAATGALKAEVTITLFGDRTVMEASRGQTWFSVFTMVGEVFATDRNGDSGQKRGQVQFWF